LANYKFELQKFDTVTPPHEDILFQLYVRWRFATNDALNAKMTELQLYETENTINEFCNTGIVVGFVIMCLGFILWFTRMQVYQDVLLKQEAQSNIVDVNSYIKKTKRKFYVISFTLLIFISVSYKYNWFKFYSSESVFYNKEYKHYNDLIFWGDTTKLSIQSKAALFGSNRK
jgi:hypothetical protein